MAKIIQILVLVFVTLSVTFSNTVSDEILTTSVPVTGEDADKTNVSQPIESSLSFENLTSSCKEILTNQTQKTNDWILFHETFLQGIYLQF